MSPPHLNPRTLARRTPTRSQRRSRSDNYRLPRDPVRVGILVVAYNAASTLAAVLDRIPASFRRPHHQGARRRRRQQDEHLPGRPRLPAADHRPARRGHPPPAQPRLRRQPEGRLPAGRSSTDLDIVVLLHGDGQYAPECLPSMVAPLERGEADAVFGSRMIDDGRRPRAAACRSTSTSATASSPAFENASRARSCPSGTRATGPTPSPRCATCPSSATPTASTSTPQIIVQLHRGREAHRRDPDPDLLRRRDLPRRTVSVRATTSPATSSATAPTRWASAPASSRSRPTATS